MYWWFCTIYRVSRILVFPHFISETLLNCLIVSSLLTLYVLFKVHETIPMLFWMVSFCFIFDSFSVSTFVSQNYSLVDQLPWYRWDSDAKGISPQDIQHGLYFSLEKGMKWFSCWKKFHYHELPLWLDFILYKKIKNFLVYLFSFYLKGW